jgi:hypothetical protein
LHSVKLPTAEPDLTGGTFWFKVAAVELAVGTNEDFHSSKETPRGKVLLEKPACVDSGETVHTLWKQKAHSIFTAARYLPLF